ncbi:hypothetical protein ES288_D04G076900v1, partial [Gossypium darwinii]
LEEFNIWEGSITEVDQWRTKKRASPNLQVLSGNTQRKVLYIESKGRPSQVFLCYFPSKFYPFFFFLEFQEG